MGLVRVRVFGYQAMKNCEMLGLKANFRFEGLWTKCPVKKPVAEAGPACTYVLNY